VICAIRGIWWLLQLFERSGERLFGSYTENKKTLCADDVTVRWWWLQETSLQYQIVACGPSQDRWLRSRSLPVHGIRKRRRITTKMTKYTTKVFLSLILVYNCRCMPTPWMWFGSRVQSEWARTSLAHSSSSISFPQSSLITMGSIAPEDLQQNGKPIFPDQAITLEYARSLDSKDHLRSFRQQFKIPSKSNIRATKVVKQGLPHYPSFHVTVLTFSLQNSPMTHAYISVVTLWVFSLEQ
jgi:hypothetical protein